MVCVLTLCELEYGYWHTAAKRQLRIHNTLQAIQENFLILPVTASLPAIYGQLKKQIQNFRRIIQENLKKHNVDLLIASTAIAESAILVSADSIYRDLSQLHVVLQYQNWTETL